MPTATEKPPLQVGVIGAGYRTDAETILLTLALG